MGILPFGNSFHLCTLYASEKSIWYHSELHLFIFPKAAFVDRYNYCHKDVESLAPTPFSCPLVLISYH